MSDDGNYLGNLKYASLDKLGFTHDDISEKVLEIGSVQELVNHHKKNVITKNYDEYTKTKYSITANYDFKDQINFVKIRLFFLQFIKSKIKEKYKTVLFEENKLSITSLVKELVNNSIFYGNPKLIYGEKKNKEDCVAQIVNSGKIMIGYSIFERKNEENLKTNDVYVHLGIKDSGNGFNHENCFEHAKRINKTGKALIGHDGGGIGIPLLYLQRARIKYTDSGSFVNATIKLKNKFSK